VSHTGTFLAIAARSALATTFVVALWGKASGRAALRSFAASASATALSWLHVVRNLILLGTALAGAVAHGPAHGPVGVLAVLAGAVTAALLIRADDLVDLFQPASR
jgi:hypothetical protein